MFNYSGPIRERKDRKVNPYRNDRIVFDDLEYTDYYKTNAPDHDGTAKNATNKFISRMNRRNED